MKVCGLVVVMLIAVAMVSLLAVAAWCVRVGTAFFPNVGTSLEVEKWTVSEDRSLHFTNIYVRDHAELYDRFRTSGNVRY